MLLDRVLGQSNGAATVSRDEVAPGIGASVAPPDPAAKLTRQQLEGYLWAAADILRGSIDSSDYKNFIFGLLFLKRLPDATGPRGPVFHPFSQKVIPPRKEEHHAGQPLRGDERQTFDLSAICPAVKTSLSWPHSCHEPSQCHSCWSWTTTAACGG